MNGTEENDYIRQTLRQAMPDDLPAAVEQRMHSRLAAFCQRLDTKSHTSDLLQFQIGYLIGGLTMRQRIGIALSGVGVAVFLGFLLLWGGIDTKPVSAMEQMAENIRKAKSYKAVMIGEGQRIPEPGKPPVKHKVTGTVYWLASGVSRSDFGGIAPNDRGGLSIEADVTKIDLPCESGGTQEFIIDHKAKNFCKVRVPKEIPGADMLTKLGDFSGQADRELGTKEINGKKSRGFEIDIKKLFNRPGISQQGMAEIWIDTISNLPILVQFKMTRNRSEETMRIQDIQWNIDLDPKLFDTTLPKGYTDITPSFQVPPKASRP